MALISLLHHTQVDSVAPLNDLQSRNVLAQSRQGDLPIGEFDPAAWDRWCQAAEEAREEGLDVGNVEARLPRLLRFSQAQTRALRPGRPAQFSFLADGRVEVSFHAPRLGVRRITFFVDEAAREARRIELRHGGGVSDTVVPFS